MAPTARTDGDRVRAQERTYFDAGAERVDALPYGSHRVCDALPRLLDLNAVCVHPGHAVPGDILEQLDTLQADRAFRHVELPEPISVPDGWESDRIVHLALRGPAPEPGPDVAEVDRVALHDLRAEWLHEELPQVADTLMAGDDRLFGATPTRAWAVHDGGRPVAMALTVGTGDVQMVEDVYTTPSHRGRGLASQVVRTATAAAFAAGAELVHIPADADARERRLYEGLGYREVAVTTRLTRWL
jgi:GNAT superfamily N-acetyltransferase